MLYGTISWIKIETVRIIQNTLEIENKAFEDKIKCNFSPKLGHKEKDCYSKYPNKRVAKTNAVITKSNTVKPSKNCPACDSTHNFKNKQGQTVFSTRMNQCIKFLNMSAEDRALLLDSHRFCFMYRLHW